MRSRCSERASSVDLTSCTHQRGNLLADLDCKFRHTGDSQTSGIGISMPSPKMLSTFVKFTGAPRSASSVAAKALISHQIASPKNGKKRPERRNNVQVEEADVRRGEGRGVKLLQRQYGRK